MAEKEKWYSLKNVLMIITLVTVAGGVMQDYFKWKAHMAWSDKFHNAQVDANNAVTAFIEKQRIEAEVNRRREEERHKDK